MSVLPEPEQWGFEKIGHRGKSFPTHATMSRSGFLIIEIDGKLGATLRQRECEFAYYVVEGSGAFTIDGKHEACEAGDLVAVPAGASCSYEGTMKLLLISSPPWTEEQEEAVSAK